MKLIVLFALPLLVGYVLQLFYSLVDTRIVGSVLGETALAAVGATTSLSSMIVGFLQGLTNGFAVFGTAFANPLPLLDHLSPPSCLMNSSWVISPEKHLRVFPDKISWAFPALGSHSTLRCSSYLTSPPPPVELLALCLSLLLGCGSLKGRGDVFLIFVACELGTVHLMAIVQ